MPVGVAFRSLMAAAGVSNPPWDVIDSTTLGSAAASVSFASIDSKYKLFRVTAYIVKDATASTVAMRLNGDTGSNYDRQHLIGNGATVSASRGNNDRVYLSPSTLAANSVALFSITLGKQTTGAAAMGVASIVMFDTPATSALTTTNTAFRWSDATELIDEIALLSTSGNFAAGTVALLEGVPDA